MNILLQEPFRRSLWRSGGAVSVERVLTLIDELAMQGQDGEAGWEIHAVLERLEAR
jgi:hypothetical protein